jgi:monoamine oxidase
LAWGEVRVRAGTHVALAEAAVLAASAALLGSITFDPPLSSDVVSAVRAVHSGQEAKRFVGMRAPAPRCAAQRRPGRATAAASLGAMRSHRRAGLSCR